MKYTDYRCYEQDIVFICILRLTQCIYCPVFLIFLSVFFCKKPCSVLIYFVLFRLKYYGFTKISPVERYRFCRAKFGWHISMFSSINELQILELSFLHIYVFQSKVQPACISLIYKVFFSICQLYTIHICMYVM